MRNQNSPVGSGSVYVRGLFPTYVYRFRVCGFSRAPRIGSALANRPKSGSYWRARRYTRPVGSSCFSIVNLCGSGRVPDVAYGFPNGS